MAKLRYKLPPVLTASKWGSISDALWQRTGGDSVRDSFESISPRLSNREAIALIQGMRAAAAMTTRGFPMWYLYAAIAYGWDPERDVIDSTPTQRDDQYDAESAVQLLQVELTRIADDLDTERPDVPPRIELDEGAFDDLIMQGEVIRALRADGARARPINAIRGGKAEAVAACRDKATGKLRLPRAKCGPDGKGPVIVDPLTGARIELPCDKPGDCKPIDPVPGRAALGKLAWLAVIGGAIYLFAPAVLGGAIAGRVSRNTRRGRRTRRN